MNRLCGNRASSPTNAVEFHTVNRVQDDSTPAHVASFFNFAQSSAVQPWQLILRPARDEAIHAIDATLKGHRLATVDDQAARRVVGVAARPAVALDAVVAILRPLAGGAEVEADALAALDRHGRERAAASGRYPRFPDSYRAADLVRASSDLREARRARRRAPDHNGNRASLGSFASQA